MRISVVFNISATLSLTCGKLSSLTPVHPPPGPGHQATQRERHLCCKSKARRNAHTQPVVPAVAELRRLLPTRIPSAQTRGIGELDVRTNSSTHPVDVAILKAGFGKTSLRYAQHGATYAFSRCHVAGEKHLPQRIERSRQSISRAIPSGLCANSMKRLNVRRAKQEHSLERHLQ
jgi:hypothetical protein